MLFWFTVAYMTTNLFGLTFVVAFGEKLSFFVRIVPGLFLFIAILVALVSVLRVLPLVL